MSTPEAPADRAKRSVHEHLVLRGEVTLAREVYVIYLEASGSAVRMADELEVEVRVR